MYAPFFGLSKEPFSIAPDPPAAFHDSGRHDNFAVAADSAVQHPLGNEGGNKHDAQQVKIDRLTRVA